MKNKKLLIGLTAILCVLSLAACGKGGNDTGNRADTQAPKRQNTAVTKGNNNLPEDPADSSDANSLFANSSTNGSVIEFSNDICTISPTRTSDDGKVAIGDAPGHENLDEAVTVHYQSGCVFKVARINRATSSVNYSDASISDIKKRASLIIYGDRSDKKNISATAVYIVRYE